MAPNFSLRYPVCCIAQALGNPSAAYCLMAILLYPRWIIKAKQFGTLPGRQHQLSYLFPAQLQGKQSPATHSIHCRSMSRQLQSQFVFSGIVFVSQLSSESTLCASRLATGNDRKLYLLAGGWLSKDSGRKPEEAQQLSFSFAAQVQDKAGPAPTQSPWHILASTGQLADETAMLRQALAGLDRQGGLYLTPVLYRPTVQVCHAHHTKLSCFDWPILHGIWPQCLPV